MRGQKCKTECTKLACILSTEGLTQSRTSAQSMYIGAHSVWDPSEAGTKFGTLRQAHFVFPMSAATDFQSWPLLLSRAARLNAGGHRFPIPDLQYLRLQMSNAYGYGFQCLRPQISNACGQRLPMPAATDFQCRHPHISIVRVVSVSGESDCKTAEDVGA